MKNPFIYLLIVTIFSSSCKDVFEEDISNKTVTLYSPYNELKTDVNSQTFWWSLIEGANAYKLLISKIDTSENNQIIELIIDTTTNTDKFTYTLSPGSYKWGVSAQNNEYKTEYSYYYLYIDSTMNLSNVNVLLLSPVNNYATNDSSITFTWQEQYNATIYNFELWEPEFANGNLINAEYGITGTTYTLSSVTEGTYQWGIQARNETSNSNFSTLNLIIDFTSPEAPSLSYPLNNDTLNQSDLSLNNIVFSWDRANDSGSSLKDSIWISSDSLFTNIIISTYTFDTTYNWTVGSNSGIFFWRVKSTDIAGNEGTKSNTNKFWYIP